MKLNKFLLPIALLFTIPLAACGEINSDNAPQAPDADEEGGGSGGQESGGGGSQTGESILHDLDDIIDAFEQKFDCTFEYSSLYGYSTELETSLSLEQSVKDIASKIDFLNQDGEVAYYSDDDAGLTGYEVYFYNDDETVEVMIYSFEYEGDNFIAIQIYDESGEGGEGYEEGTIYTNWSDINFSSYLGVNLPEPKNATQFEVWAEDGCVELYAYGATADSYADTLDDAGYYVEDYGYDGESFYFGEDADGTIEIMFFDEEGDLYICAYSIDDSDWDW